MPHQRKRQLLAILEKRLKLFPVVGLLGARQTGKSTLLRELLPEIRSINYVTLDRDEFRSRAMKQPSLFIKKLEGPNIQTVCIDEVQKAPVLFDTIKAEIDEKKRPGRFLISGSTEFSKKTGVNESLTGRISLLRFYPLNISEVLNSKPSYPLVNKTKRFKFTNSQPSYLKEISTWLERGGMPGIFAVRDQSNREALFDNWIETTCTRDLAQFNIPKFDPDLAKRLFLSVAKAEVPSLIELARANNKTPRQIEKYMGAFKALYIIYEIPPFVNSTGKSLYYIFDSGIAAFAGADEMRRTQTFFLNECYSQYTNSGEPRPNIFYYRSSKGSKIDFVVQVRSHTYAALLSGEESPNTYSLRAAYAFKNKHPEIELMVVAPCLHIHELENGIKIVPWSCLV